MLNVSKVEKPSRINSTFKFTRKPHNLILKTKNFISSGSKIKKLFGKSKECEKDTELRSRFVVG